MTKISNAERQYQKRNEAKALRAMQVKALTGQTPHYQTVPLVWVDDPWGENKNRTTVGSGGLSRVSDTAAIASLREENRLLKLENKKLAKQNASLEKALSLLGTTTNTTTENKNGHQEKTKD